jgi:hypothetical protein
VKRFALCLPVLASCALPLRPDGCPDGFAPIDRESYDWRVMSSQGVVVARRTFPNDPESSLDFWSKVLEKDLQESRGYVLEGSSSVQGVLGAGREIVLARDGAGYVVTLFVAGRTITVIEAGGPRDALEADLVAVRDWISKMKA